MGNGGLPTSLAIVIAAGVIGVFIVWAVILGLVLIGSF